MKLNRKTGLLLLALAASLLCLAAGVLTAALASERVDSAIGAVYETDPDAARLLTETLLSGRKGDGSEAARGLGLTSRYFAFLRERLFGWPWIGLMLLLALLPPACLLLIRRRERARRSALTERVEKALAGESVFYPETEEERLLGRVLTAYADLREASAQREDEQRRRVENVAHELKTPASGLLLCLDLVEKSGMTPERFARMREAAEKMQRYIGDLLTLARLRAGKLRFLREDVDLAALLETLAGEMPGVAVSCEGGAVIRGDWERLREAFRNLAANALRYGEDGSCRIRLSRTEREILVEFANRGGELPKLERYTAGREDGSSTGLGTAIAAEIMQAHFGSLSAASVGGETVLTAVFPLDRLKTKEPV